jgi:hypothetical protein
MDRAVKHDAVDCALYIVRLLPAPADVPIEKPKKQEKEISLQSKLYHLDAKKHQDRLKAAAGAEPRRKYNQSHMGASWRRALGL